MRNRALNSQLRNGYLTHRVARTEEYVIILIQLRRQQVQANHSMNVFDADGLLRRRAGPRDKACYGFDIGPSWHVIGLNDNASLDGPPPA